MGELLSVDIIPDGSVVRGENDEGVAKAKKAEGELLEGRHGGGV